MLIWICTSFFQIMKIVQHKSVRGLSVVAFEMEVIGYTIALAYCLHKGLPFSAYGELAFLLIQGILSSKVITFWSSCATRNHVLEPLFEVFNVEINFLFWFAAIILVATIYYFSPRVGNFTWIRALLYPTWILGVFTFVVLLPAWLCIWTAFLNRIIIDIVA